MTASTPTARIRAHLKALPDAAGLDNQFRFDLEQVLADADAHLEAPIFRHCLYPTCLREYDVAAGLAGRQPARPSWSGKGWKQIRPTVATGNVCPDHAPVVEQHAPQWAERTDAGAVLTCSCGWNSPAARWPGYAVAAWQNHLFEASSAS